MSLSYHQHLVDGMLGTFLMVVTAIDSPIQTVL